MKLGRDLSVDDLRARYDQIVYAVGCESDRPMGIPGEALNGSFAAIGLVFRAVGYRGIPIPGVPFDDHAGHIANVEGRVTAANVVSQRPGLCPTRARRER